MNEKKLNIAVFIDAFYPVVDGVIVALNNVYNKLAKKHNVLVIAPKCGNKKKDEYEYEVYRIPSFKIPFNQYYLPLPNIKKIAITKKLDNFKPDIIHCHSPFMLAKFALNYAKKNNIKTFFTLHSKYDEDFKLRIKFKPLQKHTINSVMQTIKRFDNIYSVNYGYGKKMYDLYNMKSNYIFLPNGCDFKPLNSPLEKINEFKEKLQIKKDSFILLFVGRIDQIKNIFFITKVLKRLKEKNFNFTMIFCGVGPHLNQLKKDIENKGLNQNTKYIGLISQEELKQIYEISDLFIFPSHYDTFGLVKLEAASQNTPTLYIKDTSCTDGIINNINGFIEEEDVEKFSDKIIEIYNDKKLYQSVLPNLKELVKSWDEIIERIEKDYKNIVINEKN